MITFRFDESVPVKWHRDIQAAAEAWNDALSRAGIRNLQFQTTPDPKSPNVISAKHLQSGAPALVPGCYEENDCGWKWYENKKIWGRTKAKIIFNKNKKWATSGSIYEGNANFYDVRGYATHEFGHWLGLDDIIGFARLEGDACRKQSVMAYPFIWRKIEFREIRQG